MWPYSKVGILDVDICGPSIPKLMGVEGKQVLSMPYGWLPVKYAVLPSCTQNSNTFVGILLMESLYFRFNFYLIIQIRPLFGAGQEKQVHFQQKAIFYSHALINYSDDKEVSEGYILGQVGLPCSGYPSRYIRWALVRHRGPEEFATRWSCHGNHPAGSEPYHH